MKWILLALSSYTARTTKRVQAETSLMWGKSISRLSRFIIKSYFLVRGLLSGWLRRWWDWGRANCHSRMYLLDILWEIWHYQPDIILHTWEMQSWQSRNSHYMKWTCLKFNPFFKFSGGQYIWHASCQGDGWTNPRTYPFFMVSTLVTNKYRWKMTLSRCVTVNYPNLRTTLSPILSQNQRAERRRYSKTYLILHTCGLFKKELFQKSYLTTNIHSEQQILTSV